MPKKTIPTAVFIELGNINHARDQQRLIYENNRQAIANMVVRWREGRFWEMESGNRKVENGKWNAPKY